MAFDFASLIPVGIQAVSSLLGADEAQESNERAAQTVRDTSAENIKTIQAANKEAASTLEPITRYASPGLQYMQSVMGGDPYTLSPAQNIELADRRLAAKRGIPKSLAGSGRFVTAAINDVENRAKAGMIADNQARADRAAGNLASTGVNATTNKASIQAGQGPQIAQQNTLAGDATANAVTSSGQSSADAIGAIGSFFANALKDQNRDTRYQAFKAAGA